MVAVLVVNRSILKNLLNVRLRSNTHIFLSEVLHMGVDVGTLELFESALLPLQDWGYLECVQSYETFRIGR
jgi:hypothetical protein